MNRIKTKSFELAVYSNGDINATKLAIVCPGKLDTKDYAHMQSHVNFLANKGFFAISFDPAGTWESPGNINLYNFTNYLKAVDELIEHFDKKPTFIMGHSRGATISIAAGVSNPNVVAFTAVMPSHIRGNYLGVTDKKWQAAGYSINTRDLPPGGGQKVKRFELPYSFFEDQITYDYTDRLSRSNVPKLFVLGSKDTAATPDRVKAIYKTAGQPKELYVIDSDHNYRNNPALIEEVNQSIGKFLKSHEII